MMFGTIAGFALARRLGRPLAARLVPAPQLDALIPLAERHGPWCLVLTRAVPVLAEASVLVFGMLQLPWRRFLPAMVLSNLGIALAYSALGQWAREQHSIAIALAASIALPAAAAVVAQAWLRRRSTRVDVHPSS